MQVQLPSVQLDQWVEDHLSATRATVLSTASAPFELTDGQVLEFLIDGDSGSVSLQASAFADIGAATLAEVLAVIAPVAMSLSGEAFAGGSSFGIRSLQYGSSGSVEITPSAAATALGLAGTVAGVNAADAALVANRNPQPNEVQVSLDAAVTFDFIRTDGAAPTDDAFVVTIDGSIAWSGVIGDGGDFQNGFFGAVEDFVPDGATIRFSLQGPEFESGQRVVVTLDVNDGQETFEWAFTAYDLTAPLLASVAAVNKDQVRVEFNEPVSMVSSAIEGDALNPDSYLIERVSRPATTPAVSAVERVSDTVVLLTTSFELTFGASYMLVVTGVSDEFDNVFSPPDNVMAFAGWMPPFPAGRRFLLHDHVPAFALAEDTTDELRLFLGCLQDTVNLLLHLVDSWAEILDPDRAPEPFLDAMLADLGNPFVIELTLEQKRKLAKVLVRIYQLKGTVPGIVDVVRFFVGIEVTIEVFNGRGWRLGHDKLSSGTTIASPNPAVIGPSGRALYSFRVLTDAVLTNLQREHITTIAQYMKGAQEHLVGVRDATPLPLVYKYWKLGFTQLGHVKIATT